MNQHRGDKDGEESFKNAFKPRGYQLEMLRESLQRNIVVAIPTGAGKTLIAIMRARTALENCSSDKIVWFCAPKVELARQQYDYICAQLAMFKAKLLLGTDNCEFWSSKTWNEALKETRIVVSTYQILSDALAHAYMNMARLALLIFDEAHHAVKKHPASEIMQRFYHTLQAQQRPPILGLTATPTTQIEKLGQLETNLDAVARTPKFFREELGLHVHRPVLVKLPFRQAGTKGVLSRTFRSLDVVLNSLNVEEDPWVIRMSSHPETRGSRALSKARLSGTTFSHKQIRALHLRAKCLDEGLGSWAADMYLNRCIRKFLNGDEEAMSVLDDLENDEQHYLKQKLRQVSLPSDEQLKFSLDTDISSKLKVLIDFLATEQAADFTGLVFVKTRVEVAMLAHILSMHPLTYEYVTATFVGTSNFSGRKRGLYELAESRHQTNTLNDLRSGHTNLIITTDALEEGIDVVSCNVVICYETPANVRSYIQRRGRARNPASRYVIMLGAQADRDHTSKWRDIEEAMNEVFRDTTRELSPSNATEEEVDRILCNESSGAKITPTEAVARLYHFCSLLTKDPFVDPNPIFNFKSHFSTGRPEMLSASVRLPNIVEQPLREIHDENLWCTEKAARRSICFEAYKTLNSYGYLDQHLLPRQPIDAEVVEALKAIEIRPNIVEVAEQMDPWENLAKACGDRDTALYASEVKVQADDNSFIEMYMVLPFPIPRLDDFRVYWPSTNETSVWIEASAILHQEGFSKVASQSTQLLLSSVFAARMRGDKEEMLFHFVPSTSLDACESWIKQCSGAILATNMDCAAALHQVGLVRDITRGRLPFILREIRYVTEEDIMGPNVVAAASATLHTGIRRFPHVVNQLLNYTGRTKTAGNANLVVLEVNKLPKRRDFLHEENVPRHVPASEWLLADCCVIDRLPLKYVSFALQVPVILHKLRISMLVEHLRSTLLLPLGDVDSALIRESILASSAREATNYQRHEFLGDSILKFTTSLMLMARHLKHFENVLSRMKDHIVSNGNLAKAAISTGLDKYIVTQAFSGAKWRPPYVADHLPVKTQKHRDMSTKILADCVEALIGAAFKHGGYASATACIKIFLPNQAWDPLSSAIHTLHNICRVGPVSEIVADVVERVVHYQFTQKPLALEAITHASNQGPGNAYERLEFLGDAILDNIVTVATYRNEPPLPVEKLHLIRTVLVNANFLGFLCFRYSVDIAQARPATNEPKNISVVDVQEPFYMWQLLRYASPTIRIALKACLQRLEELGTSIADAIEYGDRHPWALLSRLEPPKPFSDIVESIVAAIYVDSRGSMAQCEDFLERIGLMKYLRRLSDMHIALLHPKEELGQLSNQEVVHYDMSKEGEEKNRRLVCTVRVGDREVATARDGLRPLEVQTRAAEMACAVLKSERMDLEAECDGDTDVDETISGDDDCMEGDVKVTY